MERGLSVGIFLQRSSAKICLMRRSIFGKRTKSKSYFAQSKSSLWDQDAGALPKLLREISRTIPRDALRPDSRTYISLPDPFITEEQFVFQDFPSRKSEADALVSWRFGREHQRDMDRLNCSHQVLKITGNETVVLVRAIKSELVERVLSAAKHAGFFVNRLEGWSGYLPPEKTATNRAEIWSNGEWWLLNCSSADETETLFRSDWCGDEQEDSEKITRLATAFALNSDLEQVLVSLVAREPLLELIKTVLQDKPQFVLSSAVQAQPPEITLAGSK